MRSNAFLVIPSGRYAGKNVTHIFCCIKGPARKTTVKLSCACQLPSQSPKNKGIHDGHSAPMWLTTKSVDAVFWTMTCSRINFTFQKLNGAGNNGAGARYTQTSD
jgi:hypothetical protein